MSRMARRNIEFGLTDTEQIVHKSIADSESYTIPIYAREVILTPATSATATVVMPNPDEADGLEFKITLPAADSATITLDDLAQSKDWDGDFTLDANGDFIVLKAINGKWVTVQNGIA